MANTVMTKYGADYVLSAGDPGPCIAIKYFLPIYDYRLDTNIHTNQAWGTSAIAYTSTIATTSAISAGGSPTGEKIWNELGYDLSTNFIVSGVGDVSGAYGNSIQNYKQSSMGIGVNTLNGVPLWQTYYGTAFDPPSNSQNYWTVTDLSGNAGVNVQTTSTRSKYWKVTDYYPVTDTSGNIRGAFKCHLDQAVGRFKFNKIAMYAVRVDGQGQEVGELPVFFAEAFVKETCVKSNILDEGFDDFVVDVQLDLTPLNNYWVSGFYSTSGDYWTRTVGGLYYSDSVGIGSFSGGTDAPDASLHVRPVTTSANKHLIRWDGRTLGTSGYLDVVSGGTYEGSYLSATYKGLLIETLGKPDNYVDKVYVNSIYPSNLENPGTGYIVCNTDIRPDSTIDERSLGSYDRKWLDIYAQNVIATNITATDITTDNLVANSSMSAPYISATTFEGDIFHGQQIVADVAFYTPSFQAVNVSATNVIATTVSATTVSASTNISYGKRLQPRGQKGQVLTSGADGYWYIVLDGLSNFYEWLLPEDGMKHIGGIRKTYNTGEYPQIGEVIYLSFITPTGQANIHLNSSLASSSAYGFQFGTVSYTQVGTADTSYINCVGFIFTGSRWVMLSFPGL